MKKNILMILLLAALSVNSVYAQEAEMAGSEEPKIGYSVGFDVASTYLWRGYDVYSTMGDNAFNFGLALMPSVTFSMNEFSVNVWAALAGSERDTTASLADADEVDVTFAYDASGSNGSFSTAIIGYLYPSSKGALPTYAEIALSYTAPVILNPTLGFASALGTAGGSTEYLSLGIDHSFEFGNLSIDPSLLFGIWLFNDGVTDAKSHLDVSIPVGYAITDSVEAHLAFIGSYRISGFDVNSPFVMLVSLGASTSF